MSESVIRSPIEVFWIAKHIAAQKGSRIVQNQYENLKWNINFDLAISLKNNEGPELHQSKTPWHDCTWPEGVCDPRYK